MTFYSIVFGVLFLASFSELGKALGRGDVPTTILFGVLCIFVFNDILFTSHTLEGKPASTYKLSMKFIDLANFVLLASAIVVAAPTGNVLQIPAPGWAHPPRNEVAFWLLLSVYWALCLAWNSISGEGLVTGGRSRTVAALALEGVTLVMAGTAAVASSSAVLVVARDIAALLAFAYLFVGKPIWDRAGQGTDL